jgi:circadian clock protein KaiB
MSEINPEVQKEVPEQAETSFLYHLRLYVAGQTGKSITAIKNLKRICEQHLAGRYEIELIDLLQTPRLAAVDQILAVPTLVRRRPAPLKRIIGSLADIPNVLTGLGIQPADASK